MTLGPVEEEDTKQAEAQHKEFGGKRDYVFGIHRQLLVVDNFEQVRRSRSELPDSLVVEESPMSMSENMALK
jgi:hypothetical protein